MARKMPIDPIMLNAQDPKNAPHRRRGDFMPYVPAWERLPDAIKRVTAGGRPKDQAQTELCQAIADRMVKIQCKLERHTTRPQCLGHSTSGNGLSNTHGNQTGGSGLGKVTPAKTMDSPTREFFATGILGSGVDRGLHGRRYECFVQHRKARRVHPTCLKRNGCKKHKPAGARKPGDAHWLWSKIARRSAKTRCGWACTPSRATTTEI